MADEDPAGGQHLLDHPQAEREAEVEPNGVADDLRREAMAGVAGAEGHGHPARLPVPVCHRNPARQLDGAPWLKGVFADSVYDRFAALLACFLLGLTLVVIRRLAGTEGFAVVPRRWVAERTLGWLGRGRRLAKEYEELPEVSETMVKLAMIRLMLHRLAHPNRKRLPAP